MKDSSKSDPEKTRLLLLVRHGKAAPKNVGLTDFERILVPKGLEESRTVADAARKRIDAIDMMLTSPADRAIETAHVFARCFGYPIHRIRVVEMIYFADSVQPLVRYLQHLGNVGSRVAMFGHNPLFDELASYWLPGFSKTIPKSAALGLKFETASWAEISKGKGQLQFFLLPRKSG